MSYGHAASLEYEIMRAKRREQNARRASDYERHVDGKTVIYLGHPCYCIRAQVPTVRPMLHPGAVKTTHEPHTYRYVHLTDDGPTWGEYECDGQLIFVSIKKD